MDGWMDGWMGGCRDDFDWRLKGGQPRNVVVVDFR